MTKKSKPKSAGCDCFKLVNEALEREGHNARLDTRLMINFRTGKGAMSSQAILAVVKLDSEKRSKKPLPTIFAKFCPMCGKEYPE